MAFIKIRQDLRPRLVTDRFSFFMIAVSVFFCVIGSLLILVSWRDLPPQLPIFYSMPWGEGYLGPKAAIWILPAFAFSIFLTNLLFLNFFVKNNLFLGRILSIVIFLCAFFAIFDLVKIIHLLV